VGGEESAWRGRGERREERRRLLASMRVWDYESGSPLSVDVQGNREG
jgi:hypothetical protein